MKFECKIVYIAGNTFIASDINSVDGIKNHIRVDLTDIEIFQKEYVKIGSKFTLDVTDSGNVIEFHDEK